jgi:putative heme-binding domain-containing protein
MLAMNAIVDNFGNEAAPAVEQASRNPANSQQWVHMLWMLHRLASLPQERWREAARSPDPIVRVHAQRLAAEVLTQTKGTLPKASLQAAADLGMEGLNDSNALVQRCAAEAVGRWPEALHVRPLIDLRAHVPSTDTHLLYVVRKALRDQLQSESVFAWVNSQSWSESDTLALADVAIGVKSATAATFLLHQIAVLSKKPNAQPPVADVLKHVARYAPEMELGGLADYASKQLPDSVGEALLFELGRQFALFKSVDEGLQQRGAGLPGSVRQWGTNLVWRFFGSLDGYHTWTAVPLDDAATAIPWDAEKRRCVDGRTRELTSSLPHGEQLTGILRSLPFDLPEQLSFWLCGHNGFPDKPDHKKNVMRLRDEKTRAVLAEAFPPRNDVAQRITWDLTAHRGQRGFVEVTDADTGTAFAWLAFGGFAPELSALRPSEFQPRAMTDWIVAATDLAARLQVKELASLFARVIPAPNRNVQREADPEILSAFARAWAALDSDNAKPKLIAYLASTDITPSFRERLGLILADQNSADAKTAVAQSMKNVPYRVQQRWAVALTASRDGAEALLKAVEQGVASPRLLQSAGTKNRLKSTNPADWEARLTNLTKNIPTADERLEKLVEQRRKTYDPAQARSGDGAAVFTKNCAVCHSMGGQGGNVGPQLDGIGARGLERLCEDVLDPNRNVDRAFRTTVVTLKDGDVSSGLFRRQEGQLIVLADSTGKEVSIPEKQIAERRESETSLMPDNFGELISPDDFNHLMAFLLSKGGQGAK